MKPLSGLKLALLLTLFTLAAAVHAQTYPVKPIRLIVAYAPGGAVDLVARRLAVGLGEALGQNVVVENRPGASGNIGSDSVAKSAADGYTLLFAPSTLIANPLVMKEKAAFDVNRDLTAITMVASGPLLLLVHPNGPANVGDFIAQAKARPEKFNFGTGGFGAAGHLSAEWFKQRSGISGVPVILYKGTAPALTDIMGGQLSAMMEPTLSAMPQVRGGKVRALAISSNKRDPLFPDVPTFTEAGLSDMEFSTWYGVWGPASLPPAVLQKLADTSKAVLTTPAFQAWLAERGYEASPLAGQAFASFLDTEARRYARIVKEGNIRPE
jgi:tripartite-type tricarboxylate transporter receptor subunit TctC